MPSLLLNDTSLEDLGLVLYDGPPILGGFTRQRDVRAWPGRAGGIASPRSTTEPMVLRFVADSEVTTAAQRTALLDYYADLLTGLVEVRSADRPDRATRGTARVFSADIPVPPTWVNVAPRIVTEIVCPVAHRWDTQPQSRVIGAVPVPIPVGTLSHGGQLLLTGTAAGALSTPLFVRYRGLSGQVLGELGLTPALLTGEYAILDFTSGSITKVSTTGVQSNVYGWKTSGQWFKSHARHSARAFDAWGTLELTAGAGLYVWRRNWTN